ncbi:tRNA lysidine(34) synthetase TilS, partial [Candidatus Marinimicrobia bacterium]|nr:tRNA lysidine(34) synthetase TilS [Candidatus Neomarinimicrobiota bacterium]
MNEFEEIVNSKLNSYIENHNKSIYNYKFIIAISGGVDSMVLLHCLHELGLSFYTVHFDHNYHYQSKEVSRFLYNLSQYTTLKSHFNIELNLDGAKNFESDARFKRYRHLKNLRRRLNCDFILTAHHLDDQIETLHMKRIQNTHWSNSLGIREKINFIRRPLLSISKKQIINYAKEKRITWKEDPTNADNSFLRNRIRNIELPNALNLNPGYPSGLLSQQIIDSERFDKIVEKINNTNFLISKYRFGISLDALQFLKFNKVGKRLIIQQFI